MIDATAFKLAEETQWIIFGILAGGWILLWKWKWVAWTALWFVITLIIRAFANVPPENDPLLLPAGHGIPTWWVVNGVLYVDLLFVALLVFNTGGSELSPFTPLYFVLPTFALLIFGEGDAMYVYYFAAAAIIVFGLSLFLADEDLHKRWVRGDHYDPRFVNKTRRASLCLSVACLFWVMFIDVRKPMINAEMFRRRAATAETHKVLTEARPSELPPSATPAAEQGRPPSPTRLPTRHGSERAGVTPSPPLAPDSKTESRFTGQTSATTPSTASPNNEPALVQNADTSTVADPSSHSKHRASASRGYVSFLQAFYRRNLTPKQRSTELRRHNKEQVRWEVRFDRYESRSKEIYVYFSREDGAVLPQPPPVSFAKVPKTRAAFIEQLPRGRTIEIAGQLERHSASQLFVEASDIH